MMMKKILIVIFSVYVSNAFAAEVSWMYVQHRIYENGRTRNRLAFGLIDENDRNFTSGQGVKDVHLADPEGSPVKLSNYKFSFDEEIYGVYDGLRSQFRFSEEWQSDSWFSANFVEPLIAGVYRLKVTFLDGKIAEGQYKFKGIVALPIISSRSFNLHPDPYGNVIWKWDIPDALGHMVFNLQTGVKASIDIYKNNKQVAYFFIKLPSHMGYVFIPRQVLAKVDSKGDQFGLRIQLETGDNNNRSYSNTLVINDLMATVSHLNSSSSPAESLLDD